MNIFKKYIKYLASKAEIIYKKKLVDHIKDLKLSKHAKILDIGCGNGNLLIDIKSTTGIRDLYGIDIDKHNLNIASSKGIKVKRIDISQKKWRGVDNNFDLIVSNQVIEHVYDVNNYLENIKKIISNKGYIIICTENLAAWHNVFSLFFGYQPFSLTNINILKSPIGNPWSIWESKKTNKYMLHRTIMTYSALIELFNLYNFKINKIIGSVYYPLSGSLAELLNKYNISRSVYLIFSLQLKKE